MPVILRIDGYIFFFYSNEGDPREPIHVHVRKSGAEAKIWLSPQIAIAESHGFKAPQLRAILKFAQDNVAELEEAWNDYFSN